MIRYPALLLAAFACLLSMPVLAAEALPPLTIYVVPDTDCPNSTFGRAKVKIAEFEAQKIRRQARREGRAVTTVIVRPNEPYLGNLRTSEGLPTSIPVFRPLC
ncbi:hypothetical protein BH10PSE12_BH10PSE12_02600 [soil metagenome]